MKTPALLDVAPLNWTRRTDFEEFYSGYCVLGEYIVNLRRDGQYAAVAPRTLHSSFFETPDEAKEWCQIDYRKKIVSTLSATPSAEDLFVAGYIAANDEVGSYVVPEQLNQAWKRYESEYEAEARNSG